MTTTASQPVIFSDTWAGADGSAWAASKCTTTSSAGVADTSGGAGRRSFTDTSGAYVRAHATGVAGVRDSEVLTSFQWSSTSAISYLNVYLRGSGGCANAYRPRNGYELELTSNTGTVQVRKSVNGTLTTLGSVTGAQQVTPVKQWLPLPAKGSAIQFKIWTEGQPEPAAWESTHEATSVKTAGQLFVSHVRGADNVGAKTVTLDNLSKNLNP